MIVLTHFFSPTDELPIFGAPLELAVQRGRCHDGVDLPAVVRCCIDYIEEHGQFQSQNDPKLD